MTTRTWVGGGGNSVYDAADWSPNGAPQVGDLLLIRSGVANMVGGNLLHDTLWLGALSTGSNTTPAVLNLSAGADASINLSPSPADPIEPQSHVSTINVAGAATADIYSTEGKERFATCTIHLARHAVLHSDIYLGGSNRLTIDGAGSLQNESMTLAANSGADPGSAVVIDAAVIGKGTFSEGRFNDLTFGGSVSGGQTVDVNSYLGIEKPEQFHGLVNLGAGPFAEVDLMGLAQADGYSYHRDMLQISSGGRVIDTLRLHLDGATRFQVVETSTGLSILADGRYGAGGPPLPASDKLVIPQHGWNMT